jgi:hypothetical protein
LDAREVHTEVERDFGDPGMHVPSLEEVGEHVVGLADLGGDREPSKPLRFGKTVDAFIHEEGREGNEDAAGILVGGKEAVVDFVVDDREEFVREGEERRGRSVGCERVEGEPESYQ